MMTQYACSILAIRATSFGHYDVENWLGVFVGSEEEARLLARARAHTTFAPAAGWRHQILVLLVTAPPA